MIAPRSMTLFLNGPDIFDKFIHSHTLSELTELAAGNNGAYHVTALMLAASQGRSPKLFDETPKKIPPPSQKTLLLSPEKLNACSDGNFVHSEADFEVEIFEKQVGWRSCD